MLPGRSSEGFSLEINLTEPRLLVSWESRSGSFFRNLRDVLIPRHEAPIETTSLPSTTFWRSIFVPSRLPKRFLFDSYALHVLFLLMVYGLSTSPLFQRRPQHTRDPFANTRIEYYPVSEYLPPVSAAPKPARHPLKGEPAFAKQEIISVPPEPDNSRQTIVTPDLHLLKKEIPLPNMVVWGEKPAPIQPLSASAATAQPKLLLPPDVIAPAVDQLPHSTRAIQQTAPDVVKPAAEIPINAKNRTASPLAPSVVEPPPSPDALLRKTGVMSIAKLGPEVSAPKLPVPEQRSSGTPGAASTAATSTSPPPPAPPTLQGMGSGRPQGRMLALSVQPSEVKGPIEQPQGSRKGVFAAGPEGKEGGPGTPTIPGGGTEERGSPGTGSGPSHDAMEGIYVGPAPAKSTVAGTPNLSVRDKLIAAMRHPTPDIPPTHAQPPASPGSNSKIVEKVFGGKRYYSMILNMPNFSSSVGSWIIRFAELRQSTDKTDLSAPVALNKVDPAYPADLIRDKVEGTVVLYAIIRTDGTVDSIRVLDSADERLNQSAMLALSHWHFRPGTKQGVAVDIEAVVQVPFRVVKWKF